MMVDDDFMELGDTGWRLLPSGWMIENATGRRADPEGRIYTSEGTLIFEPKMVEYKDEDD